MFVWALPRPQAPSPKPPPTPRDDQKPLGSGGSVCRNPGSELADPTRRPKYPAIGEPFRNLSGRPIGIVLRPIDHRRGLVEGDNPVPELSVKFRHARTEKAGRHVFLIDPPRYRNS